MNFKLFAITSVTISLLVAAGCVVQPNNMLSGAGGDGLGAGPSSGPGGDTTGPVGSTGAGKGESAARMFYVSDVHPLLSASCTTCHATGASNAPMFMDTVAEKSYDKMDLYSGLIVAPENSQLLLHGQHTGPALKANEKDTVTHWLTMEATERGGGAGSSSSTGGGATMTLEQWLAQVGKCMDINDWKTNKLDQLPKAQTYSQGPCGACHSVGEGGNYLDTLDPTTTFAMQQQMPYVKRWFTPKYDGGQVSGLLPNPRNYQKGIDLGQTPCDPKVPGAICHPNYLLDPVLKTGIDNFINLTLTRMANKACAP